MESLRETISICLEKIGFCPGAEGMYSRVSGLAWVTYLMELHGFTQVEAKRRAMAKLEVVGMTDAMTRPIGEYSRGMRQRVKLAQALAHDPDLLILDEPFSGLDPIARHDMTELMREWIRSGKSLIIASHILHEVESITDSFLLICGGRLLASGDSHDVEKVLIDIPNEMRIRTSNPRKLAEHLVSEQIVDQVQLFEESSALLLTTPRPADLYNRLPTLAAELDITIDELQADNDSLDSMFRSLMKVHRGEA